MTARAAYWPRIVVERGGWRVCFAALLLAGCAAQREAAPPEGETFDTPWGAVSIAYDDSSRSDVFPAEVVRVTADFVERRRREHPGEKLPYNVLALSGGGANGAFGAGVLTGWTESGRRPDFDVVTGISTGALMATAAFLGPSYDGSLSIYREISNDDVFEIRNPAVVPSQTSLYDTAPLRALLDRVISDAMIDAVAESYRQGRRLFVGTTNLDADVFTIWDMGRIAASVRADRRRLYRDVVLASASFPVAFPPVYLPVTGRDGEEYLQMHVDGAVKENVFLFDYLGELKQLAHDLGVDWEREVDLQVYLLNNERTTRSPVYRPVRPRTLAIAEASIYSMLRGHSAASLYSAWTQALSENAFVHVALIPPQVETGQPLDFDPERMGRLFQLGRDMALQERAWMDQEPPQSLEDFREALRIYDALEPMLPPKEEAAAERP